jgi:hypothetical protein
LDASISSLIVRRRDCFERISAAVEHSLDGFVICSFLFLAEVRLSESELLEPRLVLGGKSVRVINGLGFRKERLSIHLSIRLLVFIFESIGSCGLSSFSEGLARGIDRQTCCSALE